MSLKTLIGLHSFISFIWWATWATETNPPGDNVTYTNNWPNEDLIGNKPTGEMIVWSVVSFVLLLGAIGGLTWYYVAQKHHEVEETYPERDPLLAMSPTPSMKATQKYFWVVAALWLVQDRPLNSRFSFAYDCSKNIVKLFG